MNETLEQREAAMRDVLKKIEAKTDFNEFSDNEKKLAKECYDAKMFEGVVLEQMISGRITAEYRHDPRLTLKGIQFLSIEEELCKKAAQEKTERKQERKYQFLLTVCSGLAVFLIPLFIKQIGKIINIVFALIQKLR